MSEVYFEFNDPVTRAKLWSKITLLYHSLKQDGIIADFKVVCDETNNTPEAIRNNELCADIYIRKNGGEEFAFFFLQTVALDRPIPKPTLLMRKL